MPRPGKEGLTKNSFASEPPGRNDIKLRDRMGIGVGRRLRRIEGEGLPAMT